MSLFRSTFLFFWRKNIFMVVLLGGIVSIMVAMIAQTLSVDQGNKIMRDMLFSLQEIIISLIMIYFVAHAIPQERRNKTLLAINARTKTLTQYILQHRAAYTLITVIMYGIFAWCIALINRSIGGNITRTQQLIATWGSLLTTQMLMTVTLMFSTFMTPIITLFCVGSTYVLGTIGQFLYRYTTKKAFGGLLDSLMQGLYYLVPPFAHINRKDHIFSGIPSLSSQEIAITTAEMLVYQFLLIGASIVLLHRMNKRYQQ